MQRYFSNELKDNSLYLSNDDIHHIKTVMRMDDKSKIEIVYQKKLYICSVGSPISNYFKIDYEENQISNKKEVILIVPILKEAKMNLVLQKATELNVNKIIPTIMTRSLIKVDGKEDKKIARWEKIVKEASEQSKRLDIPIISSIKTIKEVCLLEGNKFICSTVEKNNSLKNVLTTSNNDPLIFIFGPEGGLTKEEEELLKENNYNPITFGNTILRTETVPLYLLSCINYELN